MLRRRWKTHLKVPTLRAEFTRHSPKPLTVKKICRLTAENNIPVDFFIGMCLTASDKVLDREQHYIFPNSHCKNDNLTRRRHYITLNSKEMKNRDELKIIYTTFEIKNWLFTIVEYSTEVVSTFYSCPFIPYIKIKVHYSILFYF